ncbi:MAG: DUF3800 domain-containing protein, partial [Nisaea sp.]
MSRPITFYMDETGNRHPDKKSDKSREGRDWFGFGGVLIRGEDNDGLRNDIQDFSEKWKLTKPLHMTDMLSEKKAFAWLGRCSQSKVDEFWSDWRNVLSSKPIIGLGCVIDRPGYVKRGYLEKYEDKWLLCRSAFDIAVERAVKIANIEGRRLHIVFEQDAGINSTITGYFKNLKEKGLSFDESNSASYMPLDKSSFVNTLGRIQHKPKDHPLLQVADSYIYAMARNGYDKKFHIYRHLRDAKRIANFCLPQEHIRQMGVK